MVTMSSDVNDVWQYNCDITTNPNPKFKNRKVNQKRNEKEILNEKIVSKVHNSNIVRLILQNESTLWLDYWNIMIVRLLKKYQNNICSRNHR